MMKVFVALFALLATQVSFAAIKCNGHLQDSENQKLYVEIDGNPLYIFLKEPGAQNNGSMFSVSVLENTNIMAESEFNGALGQTRIDLQIKPAGLPKGYNAQLIQRERSRYSPKTTSKVVYLLKCAGKLPEVYR